MKEITPEAEIFRQKILGNLEPVKAIFPNGQKVFMERINKTTKYLSHNRKVIYDVSFAGLYNMGKIKESCFVIEHFLYSIDNWAHVNDPENFFKIFNTPLPKSKGTCIYLDDVLYLDNIPFLKSEKIRNELLRKRNNGELWFKVLKIVDPSGNNTLFLSSASNMTEVSIRKVRELKKEVDEKSA